MGAGRLLKSDQLNGAACCGNCFFSLLADGGNLEGNGRLEFAVGEDLDGIVAGDETVDVECVEGEFLQLIFFNEEVDITEVEDGVLDAERILEARLGIRRWIGI